MDDNNNIEDFFNNSLEGFNELPSDNVWQGISQNLERPLPLWKRILWPMLVGILFLGMSGVSIYAYTTSQKLKSSNQKLGALTALNNSLTNKTKTLEGEKAGLQKEVLVLEANQNTLRSEQIVNGNHNKISTRNSRNTANSSYITYFAQLNLASDIQYDTEITIQKFISNSRNSINTETSKHIGNARLVIQEAPQIERSFYTIENGEQSAESVTNYRSLKYHFPFFPFGNRDWIRKAGPKFKYGVTTSIIGTSTDVTSSLDPGFNLGVGMEMQLYKSLWLTSSIRYNKNNYMMEFLGQNPNEESSFPTPRSLNDTYDKVHVQNSFIDFPFGLNLNMPISRKNSLFINPGISWQFYLPQKYIYDTTNSGQIDYSESRYFMYFGSVFLNAGIERKLSGNKSLQVSFWAEQGLSQYGIESRQIVNYGLKTTLYFSGQ